MADMFSTLGTWNWLIFGFILMALELAAPGVFLFWLGLAALLVGLLSFAINPSWQTQLLMFALFAAAAVPVWRHFARNSTSASESKPFLNKRTEALIGESSRWKTDHQRRRHGADRRQPSGASPAPTPYRQPVKIAARTVLV
jgi:membrane protein implicated in regulation of membrane protease activity